MQATLKPIEALTFEECKERLAAFVRDAHLCAFVCRPEFYGVLRDIAQKESGKLGFLVAPSICGVEVFTDESQKEECLAFFDREALREHLARNRICATPNCGATGVRWWNDSHRAFYCEACARKVTAASPNLPGFDDCQFIKIGEYPLTASSGEN